MYKSVEEYLKRVHGVTFDQIIQASKQSYGGCTTESLKYMLKKSEEQGIELIVASNFIDRYICWAYTGEGVDFWGRVNDYLKITLSNSGIKEYLLNGKVYVKMYNESRYNVAKLKTEMYKTIITSDEFNEELI